MKLTRAVQEALLALLCYDEQHGAIVASLVEAKHFDPVFREIAEAALTYRERWEEPPGEHTLDLFDQQVERNEDRADLFDKLFKSVFNTKDTINGAYMVDRARAFVRYQTLKRGIGKAIRALESADDDGMDAAEAALAEATERQANIFDAGTRFIHDIPGSLAFYNTATHALPTGIPALDRHALGPGPGKLHFFVAGTGRGKSWWLINLATRAHQYHKRVLYVTLEMSKDEVCQRLVQSFFSVATDRINEVSYTVFKETRDPKEWGTRSRVRTIDGIPGLDDEGMEADLSIKLGDRADEETVLVKDFPPGTLTVKQLGTYLDLLESYSGFVPDLLIVDYAGEMQLDPDLQEYQGLNKVAQGLKALAMDRHIAVATAGQAQRAAAKAKRVDSHHTGGAYEQVAKSDILITYSQTDEERKDNIARLFVAKARSAKDRFEVLISQSYDLGQFCMSSIRCGSNFYKDKQDDDDD